MFHVQVRVLVAIKAFNSAISDYNNLDFVFESLQRAKYDQESNIL